jgi:hypothetical protein
MELHTAVEIPLAKNPVNFGWETVWAAEVVCTPLETENSLSVPEMAYRFLGRQATHRLPDF